MDDFSSESKLSSEGISTFLQAFLSFILPTANSQWQTYLQMVETLQGKLQAEALKTSSLRIDG